MRTIQGNHGKFGKGNRDEVEVVGVHNKKIHRTREQPRRPGTTGDYGNGKGKGNGNPQPQQLSREELEMEITLEKLNLGAKKWKNVCWHTNWLC